MRGCGRSGPFGWFGPVRGCRRSGPFRWFGPMRRCGPCVCFGHLGGCGHCAHPVGSLMGVVVVCVVVVSNR